MITLDQIREKMIDAIKRSGKTYTEIAKLIGVKQQTVSQYIHNNKMPALDTFANLCKVLDIDANDILCL
ncbi:MAG: helix-turn-helix transcriptional regulator [Clostridia bacterium]|nr:helix-turn-helix transcriptional regulator [Clostridia bacterium]